MSLSGRVVSPTVHLTVGLFGLIFVSSLAASFLFSVEIVARGHGKVVPLHRVQVVQPEFGGKVAAIHIGNGHRVSQGDLLIELDATLDRTLAKRIEDEMNRLRIESARIEATVNAIENPGRPLEFSVSGALSDHPSVRRQTRLFRAEIDKLEAALVKADVWYARNQKKVAVTAARLEQVTTAITAQRARLDKARTLQRHGAYSREQLLDIEEAYAMRVQDKEVLVRELEQQQLGGSELEAEHATVLSEWRNQLLSRSSDINSRITVLSQELQTALRRITASELRAPVDGIVDQLEIFTIGGVVSSGQDLVRIVANDRAYEVEVFFPNRDVGFLEAGQVAYIKLDAYPSERFGTVEGELVNVSADALERRDGTWGFVARVKPSTASIFLGEHQFPLKSGMTATIDIVTGERKLISYFFAPIVEVVQNSLGEK